MIESNTLSRQNWILLNGFARFILKDCHGLKIEIYLLNSLNFRITRNKCKKETQESILNSFHVENQPSKKVLHHNFQKTARHYQTQHGKCNQCPKNQHDDTHKKKLKGKNHKNFNSVCTIFFPQLMTKC